MVFILVKKERNLINLEKKGPLIHLTTLKKKFKGLLT